MSDLLLLATMVFVCGGVGLPLARLLPERFAWRLLVAPTLGYCVLAFLVPIAYRHGVTIPQFFWASVVLAVVSIALHVRKVRLVEDTRFLIGAIVVTLVVLMLPRWLGRESFSVFQGNHWDHFGYLESAIAYARRPYSSLQVLNDYQIMRVPFLDMAAGQLSSRPSVHQLYAVFSRARPEQAYRLAYPFLVFSFVQFAQVAMFAVRNSFPAMSRWFCVVIALVFPLGFWGQYIYDINAWSHISATPILFLLVALVALVLAASATSLREGFKIAGVLATLVIGAIYLYPEGFLVHVAAMGVVSFGALAYRAIRARKIELAALAPFAGFVAVVAVLAYPPQLDFVLAQFKFGSGEPQPWWQYFDVFFYGRDGHASHGFAKLADYVAAFFGLYFATPKSGVGIAIASIQRIAILLVIAGVVAANIGVLTGKLRTDGRKVVALWTAIALLMLLPALRLVLAQNYWVAGKVVSFASPLLMTLLVLPLGFASTTRVQRALRVAVALFVAFQLFLGLARTPAARRKFGIHYAPPYPANQIRELKTDMPWDLRPLEPALPRGTKVLLHRIDPWLSTYVTIFLYSRRIVFAVAGPVNTYFGAGRDLEALSPAWTPDAEITVEAKVLVVRYQDGRPPVRIRPR
jgi:hypothetical protein